jgi:hypothetical protein
LQERADELQAVLQVVIKYNQGIGLGQRLPGVAHVQVLDGFGPGVGVGGGHEVHAPGREQLGKVAHLVPHRDVVPHQALFLVGDGPDALGHALGQLGQEDLVVVPGHRQAPQAHHGGQMDEGVEDGHGRGAGLHGLQALAP